MAKRNERGSALMEAVPVVGFALFLVLGLLLAAYLFFTRAWIQYHSEQALYCVAEGLPSFTCRAQLEAKLKAALPWGQSEAHVQSIQDNWKVIVTWTYGDYRFHLVKQLSPKQIVRAKGLRW